jgi:hypothetical protein
MTLTQQYIINRMKAGCNLSLLSSAGYAYLNGPGSNAKSERFKGATVKKMEQLGLLEVDDKASFWHEKGNLDLVYKLPKSVVQYPHCEDCAHAIHDRCKKTPMKSQNFGIFMYVGTVRGTTTMCGKEGKWFERKTNMNANPLLKDVPNLVDCIINKAKAEEDLRKAWTYGAFHRMLCKHMGTAKEKVMFSDEPEEYPRLRSYRGTGYRLTLKYARISGQEVELTLAADWVHQSIDILEESEGCPGAPVKTMRHTIIVPQNLLIKPTQKDFDTWVKREVKRVKLNLKDAAVETILNLSKTFNLDIGATVRSEKR